MSSLQSILKSYRATSKSEREKGSYFEELKPKKELRDHQTSARGKVVKGFETADRGKLIMACGTSKTFTSLKIAEQVAGKNKRVLVPSMNPRSSSDRQLNANC